MSNPYEPDFSTKPEFARVSRERDEGIDELLRRMNEQTAEIAALRAAREATELEPYASLVARIAKLTAIVMPLETLLDNYESNSARIRIERHKFCYDVIVDDGPRPVHSQPTLAEALSAAVAESNGNPR